MPMGRQRKRRSTSLRDAVGGPADRAAAGAGHLDEGEDGLPMHAGGADKPIALGAECVIQQAGGYAGPRFCGLVTRPQ
jgi:hypothetical protein